MAKGYRVTLAMVEPSPDMIEPERVSPGRRIAAILHSHLKHSELEWYIEGAGELIEFDAEPEA